MKIVPQGWRILVKIDKAEEKTDGGIYLPEQAKQREDDNQEIGTVVELGPMAYMESRFGGVPWCKAGDKVLFVKHGGKKVGDYRVLNDEDVMATVYDSQE